MTIIQGRLFNPAGQPIVGATIEAYLEDYGIESAGTEIYASGVPITTVSSTGSDGKLSGINGAQLAAGAWELDLWASASSVTPVKYTIAIQLSAESLPKTYSVVLPNQTTIMFSDLISGLDTFTINSAEEDQSPARYDFKVYRYASVHKNFIYTDAQGTPVNMNGWGARLQIRNETGTVLYSTNTATSGISLSALGILQFDISKAVTATWNPGVYKYDIILDIDATRAIRFLEGTVTVIDGVTQ